MILFLMLIDLFLIEPGKDTFSFSFTMEHMKELKAAIDLTPSIPARKTKCERFSPN